MRVLNENEKKEIEAKLDILNKLEDPRTRAEMEKQHDKNGIYKELLDNFGVEGIAYINEKIALELQKKVVSERRGKIDSLLQAKRKQGINKEELEEATTVYNDACDRLLDDVPLSQDAIIRLGNEMKAVQWLVGLAGMDDKLDKTALAEQSKEAESSDKIKQFLNGLVAEKNMRKKEHPINNALKKIKEIYNLDKSHVQKLEDFLKSPTFKALDSDTQEAIKAQYEPYLQAANEHLARMEATLSTSQDFAEGIDSLMVKAEEGQKLSAEDQDKLDHIKDLIGNVAAVLDNPEFVRYQQLAEGPILFSKEYGNLTYTTDSNPNAQIKSFLNEPFKKLDTFSQLFPDLQKEVAKYEAAVGLTSDLPSAKLASAEGAYRDNQRRINSNLGNTKPVAAYDSIAKRRKQTQHSIKDYQSTKVSFHGIPQHQKKIDILFTSLSNGGIKKQEKKRFLRAPRQWTEANTHLGNNYSMQIENRRRASGKKITINDAGNEIFKIKQNGSQVDITYVGADLDSAEKHKAILASLLDQVSSGLHAHDKVVISTKNADIAHELIADSLGQASRKEMISELQFSSKTQKLITDQGAPEVRLEQSEDLATNKNEVELLRARIQQAIHAGLSPTTAFSFNDKKMNAVRAAFNHSFEINTKDMPQAIQQYTDLVQKRSHGKCAQPDKVRAHIEKTGILPKVVIPIQSARSGLTAEQMSINMYNEAVELGFLPTLEASDNPKLVQQTHPKICFKDPNLGLAQLKHMMAESITPENTDPDVLARILKQAKKENKVFTIEGRDAANVQHACEWMLKQGFDVELNSVTRKLFTQDQDGLDNHVLTDINKFSDLQRAIQSGFKVELSDESAKAIAKDIKKHHKSPEIELKGFKASESKYLHAQLKNVADLESQLGVKFAIKLDHFTKDVMREKGGDITYINGTVDSKFYAEDDTGFNHFMDMQINDFLKRHGEKEIAQMYVDATNTHNPLDTHYKDVDDFFRGGKKTSEARQKNIRDLVRLMNKNSDDSRQFKNPLDRVNFIRNQISAIEGQVKDAARFRETKLVNVLEDMKAELDSMEQRFRNEGFADRPAMHDAAQQMQASYSQASPSSGTSQLLLQQQAQSQGAIQQSLSEMVDEPPDAGPSTSQTQDPATGPGPSRKA